MCRPPGDAGETLASYNQKVGGKFQTYNTFWVGGGRQVYVDQGLADVRNGFLHLSVGPISVTGTHKFGRMLFS